MSDKLLGLLDKNNSRSLLFKTRYGIHTFFLKETIDVIVLDSNRIVRLLKSLKSNRIFIYSPLYPTVIELPKGTIHKSKTKVGDELELK
jgi:uncharacterized membrane protein (UPF0127 family)